MADLIRIVVQTSWNTPSEIEVLHGIRDYMRLRPTWALRLLTQPFQVGSDAVDARILTERVPARQARRIGRRAPIVSVVNDPRADVRINVDDVRIGALAADHLLERGYRRLVFASDAVDIGQPSYKRQRFLGFAARAKEREAQVNVIDGITRTVRAGRCPWLGQLPRPCGVFCPDDRNALLVIDQCRFAGIPVPEEVAVIGADNESLWCETALPPLTSVAIPWRQVGFEAAAWVERLLQGEDPPEDGLVVVVPDLVAARQSTDCVALSQPTVVQALEFIRSHALKGIAVKAVEHAVGTNRRQLDRLFLRHLGRTPYEEIRRLQLAKAKELLAWTQLATREIAAAIGMSTAYFAANFRKTTGQTLLEYRHDHQQRGLAPPTPGGHAAGQSPRK